MNLVDLKSGCLQSVWQNGYTKITGLILQGGADLHITASNKDGMLLCALVSQTKPAAETRINLRISYENIAEDDEESKSNQGK